MPVDPNLRSGLFEAVLFDRDATLIRDVPYHGDPSRVEPMPGARHAIERLRAAGLKLGVITNQSGIGRGLITPRQVAAVNERVEKLLGPFDTWQVCPHEPEAGCACRKPAPGMVHAAAHALNVAATGCVVVGDIGADIIAASAAGATGLLVPTEATRVREVAAAPAVALDLAGAADWILARHRLAPSVVQPAPEGAHVLVVRADSAGDVLLCGPAVRAVAARANRVTMLCGPRGQAAAELLPGVDHILSWRTPWIDATPAPVTPEPVAELIAQVRAARVDEAIIFTSYHQSPLPFALLLRLAGVARISAISTDYPGTLLDVRHLVSDDLPEPVRALSLAAAAGYPLPHSDRADLRVEVEPAVRRPGQVIFHPGASVPARACPPERCALMVRALSDAGYRVLVTGAAVEAQLTAQVAGDVAVDLGGRTDLRRLAELLSGASCLIAANTGPAHLAAAVRTPVVSLFAPTVDFARWGPFRTATARLGDPIAACRDTRATSCPVPGHPCLAGIDPAEVVAGVDLLTGAANLAGANANGSGR